MERFRPIYAIRPGASGDITLDDGEHASEFVAWRRPLIAPYNPSTIVVGDHLYVLLDRGIVATSAALHERLMDAVSQSWGSSQL